MECAEDDVAVGGGIEALSCEASCMVDVIGSFSLVIGDDVAAVGDVIDC